MSSYHTSGQNICWHNNKSPQCDDPHDGDRWIIFGSAQSTYTRYFWIASDEQHCEFGWEARESEAAAIARSTVLRLASDVATVAVQSNAFALARMKAINQSRRAAGDHLFDDQGHDPARLKADLVAANHEAFIAARESYVARHVQSRIERTKRDVDALLRAWERAAEDARTQFMRRVGLFAAPSHPDGVVPLRRKTPGAS
jgi:hypothetical protein